MRLVLRVDRTKEHLDQRERPRRARMCRHDVVQRLLPPRLLLIRHRQPAVNRSRQTTQIPRIDLQRVLHRTSDTHKLAQHQRALLGLLLADDKLHVGRVHAIAQWRDEREVGRAEQCVEFVLADRLVVVMHGDKVEAAEFAIDTRDGLADLPLKLRGIAECGRGDLDKDNIATVLRVVAQELLETLELEEKRSQKPGSTAEPRW